MKVSIITAVRNGARDIAVTLASVAGQDHPHIEHIVVDGASTDDTVEVVRREGRHVAQLLSEPDKGVYDAFNKGLRLATGDIVGYLNAGDTYCSPGTVRRIAGQFARGDLEATFGDVLIVDPADPGRVLRHYRSGSFSPSRLAWGFMPAHPTLFIRRTTYAHCGGYDASYRIAGDFDLCVRLFAGAGIRYSYIPEALVRMPRGGLSNSGWRSKWIITQEMRRACLAHGIPTSYAKLFARFPVKALEVLRRGG
jgi:glycosyltransferase involved in cell wall biosynthesis